MLEMFFDNEKVFSVFEQIIKSGSLEVCVPRILFELKIPIDDAVEILQSFVFLGILDETEKTKDDGIFKFNPDSPVVLSLCLFDDVVSKHTLKKMNEFVNDGDGHDELSSFLKKEDNEFKESDLEDFLNFLRDL